MQEQVAEQIKALDVKRASAACYIPVIGWIAGIGWLAFRKEPTLRWHAIQGILLSLGIFVVAGLLSVTIFLSFLGTLVWVGGMIIQLVLAVQAINGQKTKLPWLSDLADKLVRE